jgi:DNA replication licensing factor MCM3
VAEPSKFLPAFEAALKQFVASLDDGAGDGNKRKESTEYYVGLDGAFGAHQVSPRELSASLIRQMVCVEGIVTKCSLIRPKVVKSVHYCAATGLVSVRSYRDALSTSGLPTSSVYPTRDDKKNPLTTEYGLW